MTAGINANRFNAPRISLLVDKFRQKMIGKLIPNIEQSGRAVNDVMIDRPGFVVDSPSDNLDLDAIVLHVDAGGQNENAVRNFRFVYVAFESKIGKFNLLALLFPKFREPRIDENF